MRHKPLVVTLDYPEESEDESSNEIEVTDPTIDKYDVDIEAPKPTTVKRASKLITKSFYILKPEVLS